MSPPEKEFVTTSFGRIACIQAGDPAAPPVLFVHGIPTSGWLWRHPIRLLEGDFRCVAPDLMGLGDTDVDPESTPMHMEAQAEMLLELMSVLGHEVFALVCHDQGGAAAQLLVARQPQRVSAFVITDCVAYDNWPVPAIKRLQALARLGPLADWMARLGVTEWMEHSPRLSTFKRGVFDPARLTDEAISEYLRPLREGALARRRFLRFLLAGDPRYSMRAVAGLKAFTAPTLVLWAADDRFLSPSWGRRLQDDIPGARRFELIPFCGHFWQEERPAEFAAHMGSVLREHLCSEVDMEDAHAPKHESDGKDSRGTMACPPKKKKTPKKPRAAARPAPAEA